MTKSALLAATALLLATPCILSVSKDAHAQRAGTTTTTKDTTDSKAKHADAMVQDAESAWVRPPVDEHTAVSHGTVATAHAGTIGYTATAGTLTIRDEEAQPIASIFYTAYTADGASRARRPVTFFYNGGPGSSTIWLRMGSFGPMRVGSQNPEYVHPAPYAFGPNPQTLLDKTDLVFIDMVGTGWSRPLGDKTGKDFWGVDQDADAFARAIQRYITKTGRWTSPKFLFGESYGTLRSGVVAAMLEQRGTSLNGVVLLSTILNYGIEQSGYDQNNITFLPSYAATAWYHNRVPNRPADVNAFVAAARAFAVGPYAAALAKGGAIDPVEMDLVARQMSAFTGLSVEYIKRADLRVDLSHFMAELLRDQRRSVGRLDSRYTLSVTDANNSGPDDDPAGTAVAGAYAASFHDYVANTLGYKTDMPYRISAYALPGFDWDWKHRTPGRDGERQIAPNTGVDLAFTMRTNPYLKVIALNGYYDMATPFFGTEYDVAHLGLAPDLRRNISFKYYQSGHMIYLNPTELAHLHDDLSTWYDSTVGASEALAPPRATRSGRGRGR